MAANNFSTNPCRRNIFDIFQIDKSETNIKTIRQAIKNAKDELRYGTIKVSLSEAELNSMEEALLDPLERLKAEQFVHQAHHFTKDDRLSARLQELEDKEDPMEKLLEDMRLAVLAVLGHSIPHLDPPQLEDDMPWPDPPAPLEPVREGLEAAILRDQ